MFRSEPRVAVPEVVFTTSVFKVLPAPAVKRNAPVRPAVAFITILDNVLPVIVPVPVAAKLAVGFKVSVWPLSAKAPDESVNMPFRSRSEAIAAPPVTVFKVRLFSTLLPGVKGNELVRPAVELMTRLDKALPVIVPATAAMLAVGFKVNV